jgi:S-adenosylmethionine hydrolase
MQIITLLSDWGIKDHYLAVLKGNILSNIPGAVIVDISHDIDPFNLRQASYILKNSYRSFPEGTIHYIGINNYRNRDARLMLVSYEGHFFIGSDNGMFSLIFDRSPDIIIEIQDTEESSGETDDEPGPLLQTMQLLIAGEKIDKLGRKREKLSEQLHFQPVVSGDIIRGLVIYLDNYENVVTNITREIFEKVRAGRKFSIECRGEVITVVSKSFNEVPVGEIVAIFNHAGHLEIAINQGNAGGLLGLSVDDPVSIHFK